MTRAALDRKLGAIGNGGTRRAIPHGKETNIMKHTTISRRAALRGLSTAAALGAPGIASAMGSPEAKGVALSGSEPADPIFAAIAAHNAARAAFAAAIQSGEAEDDDTTGDQEHDTMFDLFTTSPTTLAGVVALLDHLGMVWNVLPDDRHHDSNYTVICNAFETEYGTGDYAVAGVFPRHLAVALRKIIAGQAAAVANRMAT